MSQSRGGVQKYGFWSDYSVCVQLGSTHHSYASRELAANEPTLKLVVYNRVGEMVKDLNNGRLQAILLDQSTAEPVDLTT